MIGIYETEEEAKEAAISLLSHTIPEYNIICHTDGTFSVVDSYEYKPEHEGDECYDTVSLTDFILFTGSENPVLKTIDRKVADNGEWVQEIVTFQDKETGDCLVVYNHGDGYKEIDWFESTDKALECAEKEYLDLCEELNRREEE
jgi:hypothetical protein